MIRVLKKTDLFQLKIKDIVFHFRPLLYSEKIKVSALSQKEGPNEIENSFEIISTVLKFTLKKVEGLKYIDNSDFELQFINDELTDDCLNEILGLSFNEVLNNLAIKEIINEQVPTIDKKLNGFEHVKIIPIESHTTKKKVTT